MSKLIAFLRDATKEKELLQYAATRGDDILYVFRGDFDFSNREFLGMIDFVGNYDMCQGVMIYSVEDIGQNEHSIIFQWFLSKINEQAKLFCSVVPLKADGLPSSDISEVETVFTTRWEELEKGVEDFFKPIPRCLSITVLEGKCFAKCRMCFQNRHPELVVEKRMSTSLFKKIIDNIPSDVEISLSICSGSETLLHNELFEMIKYVSDTKPRLWTEVTTNGVLLDEKMAQAVIRSGLKGITISVNAANRDDYKWLVGIDTYDQVVRNIHNFMKLRNGLGSPVARAPAQLRRRFVASGTKTLLRVRKKLPFPIPAAVRSLQNTLRGPSPTPRGRVRLQGLKRFENSIKKSKTQWESVVDEVEIWAPCYCKGDPEMETFNSFKVPEIPIVPTCYFLMQDWNIWPDGQLYLCCHQDFTEDKFKTPDLGNIQDANLFTLWHSQKFNEIRKLNIRGLPVIKSCLVCDLNRRDFVTDLLMKSKLRKQFRLNSLLSRS